MNRMSFSPSRSVFYLHVERARAEIDMPRKILRTGAPGLCGEAARRGGRGRETVVREARPSDVRAIARVHVDAWRETYPGMFPRSCSMR